LLIKTNEEIMSKGSFLLIYNDKAGKGSFNKKLALIEQVFNEKNLPFKSINIMDLNNQVRIDDFHTIVAIGGDGTVLSLLPYIVNRNIKLGIIPCGTANLLAGKLGISKNIKKAVDILLNGHKKLIDVGKTGDSYFVLRVGYGMDADIINGTNTFLKNKLGYLAYLIQGIKCLFTLSRKRFKICIDGECLNVAASAVIISNAGNMFENKFSVAPESDISDGKLDIFVLRANNFWQFLTVFGQIIFNKHKISRNVLYKKTNHLNIKSNDGNMHIDGEEHYSNNLDISIIPNALSVMTP